MSVNRRRETVVAALKTAGRSGDGGDVWLDLADRLDKPRRTHAEVNLGRIERYAREGETIAVPGKVLGSGVLETPVTVAAAAFSGTAADKIDRADGEAIDLAEAAEIDPEGTDVRVIR
jgi:large subunit ribosomal protein L18e